MHVDAYLERIGFGGPLRADAECLTALHWHHLRAIPYENLDVQLRRPIDLDPDRIFDKLVTRRRGGWCYEMNGLFGWALGEIGFPVTRMVGGVMRMARGDEELGNHLVLRVDLDRPMIADVGLGDGIREPIPLEAGRYEQAGRRYSVECLDDGSWRFTNHPDTIPPDFDFKEDPDEPLLAATCRRLQEDPGSLFRQNLLCMQPDAQGRTRMLIGRVLALPAEEKRLLADADELVEALAECFGLEDPAFAEVWPEVAARHDALFGAGAG